MTDAALSSRETHIENMAEAGATAAVLAFILAAGPAMATAIAGPYPELFVGITGSIWWGICGALIAIALASAVAVTVMLLRGPGR